jgi:putative ABC transport system substrate-binding protein
MATGIGRRQFISVLTGAAARPLVATAQETGRTHHLGCLLPFPRDALEIVGFFDEVRRLGFADGQNLTIDWRVYGADIDSVPKFATELANAQPDVLLAGGDLAIRALQQATTTIPILAITDDMLGSGLVDSLGRPKGNTTGLTILATELDGKRQQILIEAVPGLRRMAALADSNTTMMPRLQALQEEARVQNVELSIHKIARGEEIAAAIDAAKASGADALNVLASPILFSNRQIIMQRVATLRLPAMYQWPQIAEDGGFAAYGPRFIKLFQEIWARQLDKLLRGTKPADIPVEQPTRFELVINLKTAKALGVTVSSSLLTRADEVIE